MDLVVRPEGRNLWETARDVITLEAVEMKPADEGRQGLFRVEANAVRVVKVAGIEESVANR